MRSILATCLAALALAASACAQAALPAPIPATGQELVPAPGGSVRSFDLTAAPAKLELRPGVVVSAWAYNGVVPGPVLRVVDGDLVRVQLRNHLPVGTTIHWHGLSVPNGQDGVAGLTQDPLPPGASATYSFIARGAGTFWYHSHQRGSYQLDRGLYGVLIVEPRGESVGADHVVVYDEWSLGLERPSPPPPADPDMSAYVTVSVNGRSGDAIAPIRFPTGQIVRLRLLNAGYLVHFVRIEKSVVTVVAFDGHEVHGGRPTTDVLPLGPGERIDVELGAMDHATWVALQDPFPPSDDALIAVAPDGAPVPAFAPSAIRPVLDIYAYGAKAGSSPWPAGGVPTRSFTLTLSEMSRAGGTLPGGMPGMEMGDVSYQINGAEFPNTPILDVEIGDLVAITFINAGREDHPMHLHGHSFQVLERGGPAVQGLLVKDTIVVRPGRSVTVGFRADNPGWWMIHCHQLHHAAGGMMLLLRYQGSVRLAEMGGPYQSAPD